MKRSLIVLGMVVALAGPAYAGGVGVYGAYWDTDDAQDEGGVGAKLAFSLTPEIELELRGTYYKEFMTTVPDRVRDIEIRAYPLDLGLVYRFNIADAPVTPYLGGGGTYYILSDDLTEEENLDRGYENDEFGYFGEVGLDFQLPNQSSIFVEALYRNANARLDGDGLFEFEQQELDLSGFSAHLGIRLNW